MSFACFFLQGQKVAFVGESGSGKSTIMALLERFYDPTAGAVLVNNQDLRRANEINGVTYHSMTSLVRIPITIS